VARLAPAALLASLAYLRAAPLEAATVLIVRPASPSAALTETVSRLHGELLSVGLDVTIAERTAARGPDGASSPDWLEELAIERGLNAAIDVIGDATPQAVDIWVFERALRSSRVTRVLAERNVADAPARLAIRSIDLLRSLLLEGHLDIGPRGPPPAAPGTPTELTARPSDAGPRPPGRIGIELGAAILASLDGVGPAVLPFARVDAALGPWLGLQGELAGFGTRPSVAAAGASVRVAQQYALVGGCVCAPPVGRLRPVVALSVGALHTAAEGLAEAPLQGHSVARWSFLFEASVGARVRLAGRLHLTLAVHVQVAEPYVSVQIVNAGVATTGRPNLVASLTLGEWL